MSRHPLTGVPGIYVALYDVSGVKLGQAQDLRAQLRAVALSYAREAVAFPLPGLTGMNVSRVASNALDALEVVGRRINTAHCFDIPFEHAIAIVRACAGSATYAPSPAGIEVDLPAIRGGATRTGKDVL